MNPCGPSMLTMAGIGSSILSRISRISVRISMNAGSSSGESGSVDIVDVDTNPPDALPVMVGAYRLSYDRSFRVPRWRALSIVFRNGARDGFETPSAGMTYSVPSSPTRAVGVDMNPLESGDKEHSDMIEAKGYNGYLIAVYLFDETALRIALKEVDDHP